MTQPPQPPERVEPAPHPSHDMGVTGRNCIRCYVIAAEIAITLPCIYGKRPTEPGAPAPAQAPDLCPTCGKVALDVLGICSDAFHPFGPAPKGKAEAAPAAEPEVLSRESVYMGLRDRVKALEAELAQARDEAEALRVDRDKWHALALKHADKFAEAEQLRRERDWAVRRAEAAEKGWSADKLALEAARTALAERERAAFMAGKLCWYSHSEKRWHFYDGPLETTDEAAYAAWQATQPSTPTEP